MPSLLDTRQDLPQALADAGSLAEAFECFTSVAGSLEHSYALLQAEVGKLRRELELRNRDLASSQAETQRMRARLAHILDNLPCGVLVFDSGFSPHYTNDAARRLLSLADGAAGARPTLPSSLRAMLKEISAGPRGAERVWSSAKRSDPVSLSLSCALIPQRSDFPPEHVFILHDITEQKRLEEEREVARRMQALAEMTAILAHEIRNPLGSLELFAGLVKDATRGEPEVSQWMVHVQAGLRTLSATVNNVLHFYAQAPPDLVQLDLIKLLTNTVDFLQPLALQRGIGILWKPPSCKAFVAADSHRLQQVFFNLATNAFRAMSAGGTVTIRSATEKCDGRPQVWVAVQDQGAGIPAENLARIFEPGFTTRGSSPGLGLAVCRRVIAQHGGALNVTSVQGKGSTFTVTLPVSEPQA